MIVHFVIPRKPVALNDAYIRAGFSANRGRGGGTGMVMTTAGREFQNAARTYAMLAARSVGWPKDLSSVTHVRVEVRTFNTTFDIDAPVKLLLDAFEGIFYAKDRAVRQLYLEPGDDPGAQRVEVTVELLPELIPDAATLAAHKARRSASAQKGVLTRRLRAAINERIPK